MPTKHISIKKPLSVSLSKGYFQNPCGNVKRDKKGISKRMLCRPINMHFKFKPQGQHTRKMEKERERPHQKHGMLSSFFEKSLAVKHHFYSRMKRGGGGKLYPRHVMYRIGLFLLFILRYQHVDGRNSKEIKEPPPPFSHKTCTVFKFLFFEIFLPPRARSASALLLGPYLAAPATITQNIIQNLKFWHFFF